MTNSDYTIRSSQVFETLQWHTIKKLMDKRELLRPSSDGVLFMCRI